MNPVPICKLSIGVMSMLLFVMLFPSAYAGSSTGPETVRNLGPNGDIYTDNWRDGNCTGVRTWNAAADSFAFTWNTTGNDQIGRIGKRSSSPDLSNVRVDDIANNCIMSASANMKTLNSGVYLWTVYGWTSPTNGGNWHTEFYVAFQQTFNPSPGQWNYQSAGTCTIDGVTFDNYKNINMPWDQGKDEYMAICKSGPWATAKSAPWSGSFSIDLKKIFAYWRTQGYPNEYMADLTWAIEGHSGSSGSVVMTNVVIPNLRVSTSTAKFLRPILQVNYPSGQTPGSLFSLNGRIVPFLYTVGHDGFFLPVISSVKDRSQVER